MRVSIVIPSFYPAVVYGGPIFATLHAAEALSGVGIDIYVSATNANGSERLEVSTGRFLQKSNRLFVKYYNETIINRLSLPMLFGLWNDLKVADVVHIQSIFSAPTPMALIYSRVLGKKVLLSPRGSLCEWCLNERSKFKARWLKYLIAPFVGNVLWHATSEQERSDILKQFPHARVTLVTDGVVCSEFEQFKRMDRTQFMKKYADSDQVPEKIIISMGRLHKVKGFDILIRAFAQVLTEYKQAALLIAGKDDGDLKHLQGLVGELGLEGYVFFTGALYGEDKRDLLANADLFVLPSHTENFGIVVAESLAAGTPAVTSRHTPWSEVEKADCGMWVENSVETTTGAMLEMLSKDHEIMRKNSKVLAKKYDWKNIALDFKNVFDDMVKKR